MGAKQKGKVKDQLVWSLGKIVLLYYLSQWSASMVGHSHKEKHLTEGAWWHVGRHDAGEVVGCSTPGSAGNRKRERLWTWNWLLETSKPTTVIALPYP